MLTAYVHDLFMLIMILKAVSLTALSSLLPLPLALMLSCRLSLSLALALVVERGTVQGILVQYIAPIQHTRRMTQVTCHTQDGPPTCNRHCRGLRSGSISASLHDSISTTVLQQGDLLLKCCHMPVWRAGTHGQTTSTGKRINADGMTVHQSCTQCLPSGTVPIRSWTWTLRRSDIRYRHLPYHIIPYHTINV